MEPAAHSIHQRAFDLSQLRNKDIIDIDLHLKEALPNLYPVTTLIEARKKLVLIADKIFREISEPKSHSNQNHFTVAFDIMDKPLAVMCPVLIPALNILLVSNGFHITKKDLCSIQIQKMEFKYDPLLGIVRKFHQIRAHHLFFDIRLKAGELYFSSHRLLLASRSKFFLEFFIENAHKEQQVLEIDVNPDVLSHILHFFYTNELPTDLSDFTIVQIMVQAHLWGIEDLTNLCVEYFEYEMRTSDAIKLYLVAKVFEVESLLKISLAFINQRPHFKHLDEAWTYFKAVSYFDFILAVHEQAKPLENPILQLLFLYEIGLDLGLNCMQQQALKNINQNISVEHFDDFLMKAYELKMRQQGDELMEICKRFFQEHRSEITNRKIKKMMKSH